MYSDEAKAKIQPRRGGPPPTLDSIAAELELMRKANLAFARRITKLERENAEWKRWAEGMERELRKNNELVSEMVLAKRQWGRRGW